MDTKINPHQFDLILAVALRYAHWLPRIGVDIDGDGKISTPLVIPLTTLTPEEFIGEVEKVWLSTSKRYNSEVTIIYESQHRSFKLYNLLWGRMCVTAYFFYHNDPFWKTVGLREMRALNDIPLIQNDLDIAIQRIDAYYEKIARVKLTNYPTLSVHVEREPSTTDTQQSERIAELEQQLAQKDEEIARLNTRIQELEEQLNVVHLSFIETEGKNPDVIKCVYIDIKKATVGPAEMAECIHDLHIRGLLKNQERHEKLKNIKKIHKELQDTYHFEWTYDAFRRALKRKTTKK